MMGCDIHIVLEYRREGQSKWIGQWCSDNYNVVGKHLKPKRRDYGFFGRLAHVRSSPPDAPKYYARNLPSDLSELAWDMYISRPTDHHTPSHLSISEFCDAYLAENSDVRKDFAAYDLLGVDPDDGGTEYRIVFWFDN